MDESKLIPVEDDRLRSTISYALRSAPAYTLRDIAKKSSLDQDAALVALAAHVVKHLRETGVRTCRPHNGPQFGNIGRSAEPLP